MNENDPIDQIFAVILRLSPKFSEAVRQQAEAEIRAKFGGERHYIAKKEAPERDATGGDIQGWC